jgi:hypothetical protein
LVRLREQAVLQSVANNTLGQHWKKRHQLPKSIPDFLEKLESRLPPTFHEDARMTLLNETAGWFATHPTPAQRIRQARRLAVEGIFTMEQPARLLFNDFTGTSQLITGMYYRQTLRLPITEGVLKPASEFFTENDHPASGI